MKTIILISAIASLVCLLTVVLYLVMDWPGVNQLLVLFGILFVGVLIPAVYYNKKFNS